MLILFLVTLFVPLLLGVPVAFSLVISAIVLMASQDLFSSQLIVQQFVGGINSFSLLAVPFFMLAGELMNKGGITRRIGFYLGWTLLRRPGLCGYYFQYDFCRLKW